MLSKERVLAIYAHSPRESAQSKGSVPMLRAVYCGITAEATHPEQELSADLRMAGPSKGLMHTVAVVQRQHLLSG